MQEGVKSMSNTPGLKALCAAKALKASREGRLLYDAAGQ
jgi:hypothetical protein